MGERRGLAAGFLFSPSGYDLVCSRVRHKGGKEEDEVESPLRDRKRANACEEGFHYKNRGGDAGSYSLLLKFLLIFQNIFSTNFLSF